MPSLLLWGWGEMGKCLIGLSRAGGWVGQRAKSKRRPEGRSWDWPGRGFLLPQLVCCQT